MKQAKNKAFTLIELLVTIAIIGVLVTIAIIAFSSTRGKARDSKRKNDVNQIGRFLTFGCIVPDDGPGTYDLNELLGQYRVKYPQFASSIPSSIDDPKASSGSVSGYTYIVDGSDKCVLYANLENEDERITLQDLTDPTPGGGKGILEGAATGVNGTNIYFQVSN